MIYFSLRAMVVISVLIFVFSQQFSTNSMGLGSILGGAALLLLEAVRWQLNKVPELR